MRPRPEPVRAARWVKFSLPTVPWSFDARRMSDPVRRIEHMFGIELDELTVLADRMCAATRAENQAAGARLVAISELDLLVLRRYGERETWLTDTQAAISAEIAAALRISRHWAASYLYYARALRIRLPKVGHCCAPAISAIRRSRRSCIAPI